MQRRLALKSITTICLGVALLPGCQDQLFIDPLQATTLNFNSAQGKWIDALSEAMLPKKDITLTTFETLPEFIAKMIPFHSTSEDQQSFLNGYNVLTKEMSEEFDVAPDDLTSEQIISKFESILYGSKIEASTEEALKNHADKTHFSTIMRELNILFVKTSKEYQEEVLEYKLVPGFYNACESV